MINNNKVARIKLSVYMIMLLLFVNFLPLVFQVNQVQVYAEEDLRLAELGGLTPKEWYDKVKAETGNGSTIKFEEKSQLLVFVNETRAASSINVIRFSTIGWQVRFEPIDGSTKYMTWINPYWVFCNFSLPHLRTKMKPYIQHAYKRFYDDIENIFGMIDSDEVKAYWDYIKNYRIKGCILR